MRRILLTFALMLWASQVEADVLFKSATSTLSVRAVFNDTGTNTFCWQCGDADPLNDFRAVLNFSEVLSAPWDSTLAVPVLRGGGPTEHSDKLSRARCELRRFLAK